MAEIHARYPRVVLITTLVWVPTVAGLLLVVGVLQWWWTWLLLAAGAFVSLEFLRQPSKIVLSDTTTTLYWPRRGPETLRKEDIAVSANRSALAWLAGAEELELTGGRKMLIWPRYMTRGEALIAELRRD